MVIHRTDAAPVAMIRSVSVLSWATVGRLVRPRASLVPSMTATWSPVRPFMMVSRSAVRVIGPPPVYPDRVIPVPPHAHTSGEQESCSAHDAGRPHAVPIVLLSPMMSVAGPVGAGRHPGAMRRTVMAVKSRAVRLMRAH